MTSESHAGSAGGQTVPERSAVRPFAWHRVVQLAILYYVLAAVALHFLQPDLPPLAVPMSAYANGRAGLLMTLTFFALAAALLGTAVGLWKRLPLSWPLRIAILFFVLGAIAATMAGIFPAEPGRRPPELPVTRTGRMHMLAGLVAFPSFMLGPLFATLAMRRSPEWRSLLPLLGTLVTLLALSVVAFGAFAAPRGLAGIAQRILLALLFVWLLLVARRTAA